MDEQRLKILFKDSINYGEFSSLIEFLIEELAIEMKQEIDKEINNFSILSQSFNNNNYQINNSIDLWFTKNEEENLNKFNNISSELLQLISNNLINNSLIYKRFNFKIINLCSQIIINFNKKNIKRRSSSSSFSLKTIKVKEQWRFKSISKEEEEEIKLGLSGFSLDYSIKDLPEEELCSIIGLIVDDDLESNVRKINLRKLIFCFTFDIISIKRF
ncbi:hypothetical protein Mgra_00000982 [Meloidogyne graminicola]|uniref:Uncharacterized protein n=1 Tax=Meloidogyne graminicola TaxID=189291 RepID=A0A8T0A2Y3_9BILA|nr:hypothetical protein Mgra_00000982 [Meloidogyne graminicola]